MLEYIDFERTANHLLQVTIADRASAQETSTLMTQDRAILYRENVCTALITRLVWPATCALQDILAMLST